MPHTTPIAPENAFDLSPDGELILVVDRTQSMGKALRALAAFLPRWIIRKAMTDQVFTGVHLITFDDHYYEDEQYMRQAHGPVITDYGRTENLEEFAYWVKTIPEGQGMDLPEAIACALAAARTTGVPGAPIWLITDAVPHGALKNHDDAPFADDFERGCPCGIAMNTSRVHLLLHQEEYEPNDELDDYANEAFARELRDRQWEVEQIWGERYGVPYLATDLIALLRAQTDTSQEEQEDAYVGVN